MGDPSATKYQAKAKAGGNGSSIFGRQRNKENCQKWRLPDMAQPGGKNGSGEEERELHTTFYSDSAYRKYQKKREKNLHER
jgi:hypothetical protein